MADPNIASVGVNVGLIGNNATGGSNTGRMFVELKPRDRAHAVGGRGHRRRCGRSWREIPGIRAFLVNQPPINLGGGGRTAPSISSRCRTPTPTELYRWAPVLEQRIRQMPGFEDVSSDLQLNNPQVTVEMDRDKLSSLGLTATQVETALYNAYGTRQVSQIFAPEQSVPGDPARGAGVPERSGGDVAALRPLRTAAG